jgi:hypothetical protein
MPNSPFADLTRRPAVAPVREPARAFTYVVARERRGVANVRRERSDAAAAVLARSARRLRGPAWQALATAILLDATGDPPPAKLARDLARFIVVGIGRERSLSGEELVRWLDSWRTPAAGLFGGR